jgi:hypothetical protein
LVIYDFSRSKVERGDFSHFLGLCDLDRFSTVCRLCQMIDSMVRFGFASRIPPPLAVLPSIGPLGPILFVAWGHSQGQQMAQRIHGYMHFGPFALFMSIKAGLPTAFRGGLDRADI